MTTKSVFAVITSTGRAETLKAESWLRALEELHIRFIGAGGLFDEILFMDGNMVIPANAGAYAFHWIDRRNYAAAKAAREWLAANTPEWVPVEPADPASRPVVAP